MIRASTTPSIAATRSRIAAAIRWAVSWFLPVTRMLIGVDLPSFIAAWIIPPASKANSRSANRGSLARPSRSRCDVLLATSGSRSAVSCTRTTASIGPALGVNAADQSGVTPISVMIQFEILGRSSCLRKSSTSASRSSVSSIRVPLGATHGHLERARVDVGVELAAQDRVDQDERPASRTTAVNTTATRAWSIQSRMSAYPRKNASTPACHRAQTRPRSPGRRGASLVLDLEGLVVTVARCACPVAVPGPTAWPFSQAAEQAGTRVRERK